MKKYKLVFIIIFSVIIIVISGFGIKYGYALYIKHIGITIKPSRIYEPIKVIPFLQNDEKWKTDKMGNSEYTLGGYGCLIASISTVLNNLDIETNPKELNKLFSEKEVYNQSGEVIWYKIGDVFPDVFYKYERIFGSNTIEKNLKQERLPVVKVRYFKTGVFHWIVIAGSDENDFIIIDPLNKDRQPIGLGTHGKVYAYRVLVKEDK